MTDTEEERKLKTCLEACNEVLQETTNRLRPHGQLQHDGLLANGALDVNIHSFTLNTAEEALMTEFKANLETTLNDHLPSLPDVCRKYLLDFLYKNNYNYEHREFTVPFNIGILDSFARDLQSILASINGVRAAWLGDLQQVQDFIKKYPNVKDKSGIWSTTLLYSAARNNHLNVVRYLLRTARCSVNAQNQQHIIRALPAAAISDEGYHINPTAGSTALHGACYYGHLDIVKCLIEHGADYFLTNHASETPIDNANMRPDIITFFRAFLILGYSAKSTNLPNAPILEGNEPLPVDCFWEYKPLADRRWFPFSDPESFELQKSLIVKPDQQFKHEIHLTVRSGVYSVSMMKFLRSGKDLNHDQRLAWVRCRGSSVLNFDCYALWQIMFTTHPSAATDSTLQILNIPTIYDSSFTVHLNSWYYCDARTNNQLDKTMSSRRKNIILEVPFICTERLTFDLQTFSFSDKHATVTGFIRWVPKMISNNPRHNGKIISVDQYETLTNMDPIPLTTARLKQASQGTDSIQVIDEEELGDNINNDDSAYESILDVINDDPISTLNQVSRLFSFYTTHQRDLFTL